MFFTKQTAPCIKHETVLQLQYTYENETFLTQYSYLGYSLFTIGSGNF